MEREVLMDVAMGELAPDLVIKGGKLVDVHTGETYTADVIVKGDRIAAVGGFNQTIGEKTKVLDAEGKYLTPGLIDTHMHIGACHLTITQLARALTARGTTAIASDFYEVYSLLGARGVKFLLEEARKTPLKILYVVPVLLIGFEKLGTFGVNIDPEEMKDMLRWSDTIGLNEPPPSKVLGRNRAILDLIQLAREERKIFVGHACETFGRELNAYISQGAYSEHECKSADEALLKVRLGMRIMMREGSASPDLDCVIKTLSEHRVDSHYFMFCTDEVTPPDLVYYGHMDYKVRKAIKMGMDPITAIQMATINAAEYYKVDQDIGSIVPGKIADILIIDSLPEFKLSTVVADGKVVAHNGKFVAKIEAPAYPEFLKGEIRLKKPVEPKDFQIRTGLDKGEVLVRVIGVEDGTLLKKAQTAKLSVKNGYVLQDVEKDILKISAIERNRASGRIGNAFVSGFGLKEGAVASTYSLVYQNLVVVGTTDEEMSEAANRAVQIGGGIVVTKEGRVLGELRLPIGGIISEKPLEEVEGKFEKMHEAIRGLGCEFKAPILTLAFVTVNSIPAYGITDRGLIDVDKQEVVDPTIAR